jgi:tetratricopeptide (TPR) repeat protein
MNLALLISVLPALWQGGEPVAGPVLDARTRLVQAQAAFDEAVAMKNHSSPDAQRLYRQALVGFQSLIEEGFRTAGLYYNVGNTCLRLGDVGRAIVNYRRALRLRPGDENIRKNLQSARNLCELQLPKPAASALAETILFWHYGTSAAARARAGLAAYAAFWLLLLARLVVRRGGAGLRWTAGAAAGLALVLGASAGWDRFAAGGRMEGVITAERAVLRKGNGEYYDPQLDRPLPAGVEVRVMETREDVRGAEWLHVLLTDGKEGWLRAAEVEVI